MADYTLPTADSWARIQQSVRRLEKQVTNLFRPRVGVRHGVGGNSTIIKFELTEELRRGQTKAAVHVPWVEGRAAIENLEVTEDGIMSSEMRAPAGTRGRAIRGGRQWIILDLDCDKLESHDGDPQ